MTGQMSKPNQRFSRYGFQNLKCYRNSTQLFLWSLDKVLMKSGERIRRHKNAYGPPNEKLLFPFSFQRKYFSFMFSVAIRKVIDRIQLKCCASIILYIQNFLRHAVIINYCFLKIVLLN